ncbi:MAG: response regulator [Planctomycetaceae bacterium]|nr:response regulator [Planctomycetaceae bacterium]
MSTTTILVIDDSATIRKMVDSHLSQEGYRVMLAPNGEDGVEMARELIPDLILLDHQLPGTTGIEVCKQIIQFPECAHIPFVVSSTLRKQAYVEYMDVSNVVDSLPKPFKADLLKMTVANALETGAMIVSSQANGTAVPETVEATTQASLTGDLRWLGLRELIDFLNNGRKTGMLEVQTQKHRVNFFLKNGRVQGVVSPSFDSAEVSAHLPPSMSELSPLLQFTMSSGTSTRVDGLVELMDKKILDPRMLRLLLRHQAAVLTRYCFLNDPGEFTFVAGHEPPSLFATASIDSGLAAILVEGALHQEQDMAAADRGWVKNSVRGQNLDRAGLSARHTQLLSHLDSSPRTTAEMAQRVGLDPAEAAGVLEGLLLAEWVENRTVTTERSLVGFEPDAAGAGVLRGLIADADSGWTGNVVRDEFSLQLLLKRKTPDAVLIALTDGEQADLPDKVKADPAALAGRHVVLVAGENAVVAESLQDYPVLRRPFGVADVLSTLGAEPVTTAETSPERIETADCDSVLSTLGVE